LKIRLLFVYLGFVLISSQAFPQVLACSNLVGGWEDYWSFDEYSITQDANGNLSGYMTVGGCTPNDEWPMALPNNSLLPNKSIVCPISQRRSESVGFVSS
jgi:hypothetical protein